MPFCDAGEANDKLRQARTPAGVAKSANAKPTLFLTLVITKIVEVAHLIAARIG